MVQGSQTQMPYVVSPSSIARCIDATLFSGTRVDTNGVIVPFDAIWHIYRKCCYKWRKSVKVQNVSDCEKD